MKRTGTREYRKLGPICQIRANGGQQIPVCLGSEDAAPGVRQQPKSQYFSGRVNGCGALPIAESRSRAAARVELLSPTASIAASRSMAVSVYRLECASAPRPIIRRCADATLAHCIRSGRSGARGSMPAADLRVKAQSDAPTRRDSASPRRGPPHTSRHSGQAKRKKQVALAVRTVDTRDRRRAARTEDLPAFRPACREWDSRSTARYSKRRIPLGSPSNGRLAVSYIRKR